MSSYTKMEESMRVNGHKTCGMVGVMRFLLMAIPTKVLINAGNLQVKACIHGKMEKYMTVNGYKE